MRAVPANIFFAQKNWYLYDRRENNHKHNGRNDGATSQKHHCEVRKLQITLQLMEYQCEKSFYSVILSSKILICFVFF